MRIALLSNYTGAQDEGMMNMAFHLADEMAKSNEVFHVNARRSLLSRRFWQNLKNFRPQIIHVFLRPSLITLSITRALRFYSRESKVVMSSLQPPIRPHLTRMFIPLLKPDLMLIQSDATQEVFADAGCNVAFLPSGVDISKFAPRRNKEALREKYLVDKDKFVLLHVGPILKGRNHQLFFSLQGRDDYQVLLVTGMSFEPDWELCQELQQRGCIIKRGYFADLEEIYGLADCYLFPTINPSNAIEFPLSVLEAMACNLPVISAKFGALPRVFQEGDGLYFIEKEGDIATRLEEVRNSRNQVKTREKALPYSWENTAKQLNQIYNEVLDE